MEAGLIGLLIHHETGADGQEMTGPEGVRTETCLQKVSIQTIDGSEEPLFTAQSAEIL